MAFKDMLKKPWLWIVVVVVIILLAWVFGLIPGLPKVM